MSNLDDKISSIGDQIRDVISTALTAEDVRMNKTDSLEFRQTDTTSVYNKGLMWTGGDTAKQLTLRPNPDRFFSTESIDIHREKAYHVDGILVLDGERLGPSVTHSNLNHVGTLTNLRTQGNLSIDEFMFYDADSMRFGIGTNEPNGTLGIANLEGEFIIDADNDRFRVGSWTTSDIEIITDDTTRIHISEHGHITVGSKGSNDTKLSVHGRLGVGVNNIDNDVSISTAGPIKLQGKKQEVGDDAPEDGNYKQGDIVWNSNPRPTSYIGWVCVREGTPGNWKPFGQITG